MYKSFSMELAGRTLTVDIDRVAKQANGAAFMHYGETTVLSTATASEKPREGIDFFPGIHSQLLHAERYALVFGIDEQDNCVDFVALFEDFRRMVYLAGPAHVGDVNHAVDAFLSLIHI